MLELIDKGYRRDNRRAPVVFVHGRVHAAWCWDEHSLDFFADHGYRALALSLRGHGASPTAKRLKTLHAVAERIIGWLSTLSHS
jgi:pimeloyl-ACP methyl ester carboxylesterase